MVIISIFFVFSYNIFSGRNIISRISWEGAEKNISENIFRENIDEGILPSKNYCQLIVTREPTLKRRTADQLKAWVYNQINKKKRIAEQVDQSLEMKKKWKKIRSSC